MHSRHSRRCGNKASRSWARRGRSFLAHRGCRLLAGGRGVLCRRLNCPCDQFLVPTALTLPERKNRVRIGALIYGSRRRNDLATATWARTAARGAPLDIDYTQKLVLVVHGNLNLHPLSVVRKGGLINLSQSKGMSPRGAGRYRSRL